MKTKKKFLLIFSIFIISFTICLNYNYRLLVNKRNIGNFNGDVISHHYTILNEPRISKFWKNFTFIHITGTNWSVAASYDWCTGKGTFEEPYVIENITIDASNSPTGHGILIEYSNVYFKIKNCTIFNVGSNPLAAIKFNFVANSYLIDNNLYNCGNGIYIQFGYNHTIMGNHANNNQDTGIWLHMCYLNNISGNEANNNNGKGIFLQNCNYSRVSGNTANENSWYGISFSDAFNNTILDNNVNSNDHSGIALHQSYYNNISGNNANNNDNYGIMLLDSSYNKITGNSLINNDEGIYQDNFCEGNTIANNYIKDSEDDDDDDDDKSVLIIDMLLIFIIFIILFFVFLFGLIELSLQGKKEQKVLAKTNKLMETALSPIYPEPVKEILNMDASTIDKKTFEEAIKSYFKIDGIKMKTSYSSSLEIIEVLNKRLSEVKMSIQKKQISNYRTELEKIFLDAGDYYFKKFINSRDFRMIINQIDECIRFEFSQMFGEIELLIQQNQDTNAKNEFEKIILLIRQHYFKDILFNISEKKIVIFEKNISEVKGLFKPKEYLDEPDSLSQNFIETKKEFFKKILKPASFKRIKNYIMNLKQFYLKKRLTEIEQLIQEKNFSITHSELTELMIDAKRLKADGNLKRRDFKNILKKISDWKKILLEKNFIQLDHIVKTKQFSKAFGELNDIFVDFERYNIEIKNQLLPLPVWSIKRKMWDYKRLELKSKKIDSIKSIILDMGQKFPRIQVSDIIEKTEINDEDLTIKTILEMITNKEIYAEYFQGSKSILFNQQANLEEIDKLLEKYKKWEEREDGKI